MSGFIYLTNVLVKAYLCVFNIFLIGILRCGMDFQDGNTDLYRCAVGIRFDMPSLPRNQLGWELGAPLFQCSLFFSYLNPVTSGIQKSIIIKPFCLENSARFKKMNVTARRERLHQPPRCSSCQAPGAFVLTSSFSLLTFWGFKWRVEQNKTGAKKPRTRHMEKVAVPGALFLLISLCSVPAPALSA